MERNDSERRREPRRSADRGAMQQMGQQPQPEDAHEDDEGNPQQDAAPSFFRVGEFAVRDPSLPERRSGDEKRKGARRIQVLPDSDE